MAAELGSPEAAWATFRKAALEKQYWRAYCCFSTATQERLDYFDFAWEGKKKKYRKAFEELVVTGMREVSPTCVEYMTNYKEPFDRFEMIFEDDRWRIQIPQEVFDEE